jgi:hypothetical protein
MRESLVLPFSLGMRTLAYQVVRAEVGPRYGPAQTVNIYCDASSGGTTVDGFAQRTGVSETWAQLHSGAGLSSYDNINYNDVGFGSSYLSQRFTGMARIIMTYSLAGIPAGSLINWAKYRVRCFRKYDTFGYNPGLCVYQSNPSYDNNVVNADYQHLYSVELSNIIYYSQLSTSGWNEFTLNEAGLALLVPGQICRLGMREAKFDGPNVPPTWKSSKAAYFQLYSRENSSSYRPYLQVNYSPLL